MIKKDTFEKLLEIAIKASIEAGEEICNIYNKDFEVNYKKDDSPLTLADTSSHRIINGYLKKTGFPVLSEEGKEIDYAERRNWQTYWIIDPLDGTKEFVKRNGDFTVNIALIQDRTPVLGVIYVPVTRVLYFASHHCGSFRFNEVDTKNPDFSSIIHNATPLPVKTINHVFTVVGSKSHLSPQTENFIEDLKKEKGVLDFFSRGSSLKICMVAEGSADVYPRFAPTMEWDIAAGHAIAKYAGAILTVHETGKEMIYNNESLVNPWFIVQRQFSLTD